MTYFLVDEDLPRTLAGALRRAGHEADDVRDLGMQGSDDDVVFSRARALGAVLVTGDLGFGHELHYPPADILGLVIGRLPSDLPVARVEELIIDAITTTPEADLLGSILIVEPGRLRLRRRGPTATR